MRFSVAIFGFTGFLAAAAMAEVPENCRGCQLSEAAFKRVEGRWLRRSGATDLGEVLEFKGRRQVLVDGHLFIPCDDGDFYQLCPRSEGRGKQRFKVSKKGRELSLSLEGGETAEYVWPLGCEDLFKSSPGKGEVLKTFLESEPYVHRQSGNGALASCYYSIHRFFPDGRVKFLEESGRCDSNNGPDRFEDQGTYSLKGLTVVLCLEKTGVRELQFDPLSGKLGEAISQPGSRDEE